MAFNADNFNGRSSKHARLKGRQFFSYDAVDDTLATVITADYFLDEFQGVKVGDIIETVTDAGIYNLEVLTSTAAGLTVEAGSTQTLAGPGAVDTITATTDFESTGVADALTLIDGALNQRKVFIHAIDGGSAVLTPTTGLGYTTITFTTAGEAVTLEFRALGWAVIGIGGVSATLPVVA